MASFATALSHTDSGPADGPCVVLIHGWSCTRSQWAHQMASLAERYRTVAIDLPGHGDNPVEAESAPPTIEAFADRIYAFIETTVRDAPVVLVGHSLGAAVAAEAACRLDERAALVVALDGLVYLDVYERQAESEIDRFLAPLAENYDESALTYLESLVHAHDGVDRGELERTCSKLGQEFGLSLFRALMRWDMAECLAATPVPVTALCASATLDADVYERYGARIDMIPIGGAGHFLHMEAPQVVTPILHGLIECRNHLRRRPHIQIRSLEGPRS